MSTPTDQSATLKHPSLPHLSKRNHKVTSPPDGYYNCIAWAAEDNERWWEPGPCPYYYWPEGVPHQPTVAAYVQAFETLGYKSCDDGSFEQGFQKVVLYVDKNGNPTHMARQLPDGRWASKLGEWYDIEHQSPAVVAGGKYGTVKTFLKRPA